MKKIPVDEFLRQIASASHEIGSGLDAIDRGFGNQYYEDAVTKTTALIAELPPELCERFPRPDAYTWSQIGNTARSLQASD